MSIPVIGLVAIGAATSAPAISAITHATSIGLSISTPAVVDYRSSTWLGDRDVVNTKGETIAEVSDLILDRGSGRIEYLIIKTGAVFGLGGRAVAMPFGAFTWEPKGNDRFVLAMTAEQLRSYPEYTTASWNAMREPKAGDTSTLRQRLTAEASAPSDAYAGSLADSQKAKVEGEVVLVQRAGSTSYGEQVHVTVRKADGTTQKVALGPSWYVNSMSTAPNRGDIVVIDALTLPRDESNLLVATNVHTGNRKLHLRGNDGKPAWALQTVDADGTSYSTPYSKYLLLSDMTGMKVDCRGIECGKVVDIIVDRPSGVAAFLSINPTQNFLGIGDTYRLVPWSIATVNLDKVVRIDASKDMVLATPETPKDLGVLSTGPQAADVYKAFQVEAPRFDAPKARPVAGQSPDHAWSTQGAVISNIESNSTTSLTGTVIEVTEVKFDGGTQPARAMRVRTSSGTGSEELVLLGPAWYMNNQKPVCSTGDTVNAEVCRTTVDGRRYWIARSIQCKDARVVMIGDKNAPAWNRQ